MVIEIEYNRLEKAYGTKLADELLGMDDTLEILIKLSKGAKKQKRTHVRRDRKGKYARNI